MNEKIRQKKPVGPVIRAVKGDSVLESNKIILFLGKTRIGCVIFDPKESPVDTHEVKAWVELEEGVTATVGGE